MAKYMVKFLPNEGNYTCPTGWVVEASSESEAIAKWKRDNDSGKNGKNHVVEVYKM